MQTLDKQTVELDSSCVCAEEDGTWAECWGCWDDSKELYAEMLEAWKRAISFNEGKQVVRIDGRAMTWLRRDGYAVVEADKVLDALQINGDFRLVFTLEGTDLKCVRYSHDEPVGAYFSFSAMEQPEEE